MKSTIPPFITEYAVACNSLEQAYLLNFIDGDDNDHVSQERAILVSCCGNFKTMIDRSILEKYGAIEIFPGKGEILFHEGSEANNYYQIVSGSVKMVTNNAEGQEFIQGVFNEGDSFGEPPLFGDFPYPSSAIVIEDSVILKLTKHHFIDLLRENFEIHLMLNKVLCNRLKYKSMILSDISFNDPEQRIGNLLHYFKRYSHLPNQSSRSFIVPYTRQQIADMSGLRVETVIRTVKKMEKEGKLEIVDRKIRI
ncbi:MAG TPA: Crp/Fnr family transcriptional regulator [Cyclobacteriaceae bacterium]|nr:Crp/Fnr family transcriptional regulator [Cyclobacteriaceae bacterium]